MWQAIQYVTGGFTLSAFIAALIAWAYINNIREKRKRIDSASDRDRAELVSETLEFFKVDTTNLTKQQQCDIAMAQIEARIERFRIAAAVIVLFALLGTGVTVYALSRTGSLRMNDTPSAKGSAETVNQVRGVLTTDADSPDSLSSCPVGMRADLTLANGKLSYYQCNHTCFATWDTVDVRDLDFQKIYIQENPQYPNWSWVEIPCLGIKGKCISDLMGTVGNGTKDCTKRHFQEQNYTDELHLWLRSENAPKVLQFAKQLAPP